MHQMANNSAQPPQDDDAIPDLLDDDEPYAENLGTEELTTEEAEAMFAAQAAPRRGAVGSTAVMDDAAMDDLLGSLGADASRAANCDWLPHWAAEPRRHPRLAPMVDLAPRQVVLDDLRQMLCDLDVAVATVDDTTVASRDQLYDLAEDVKALQIQTADQGSALGAQVRALSEEVGKLRLAIGIMGAHLARLAGLAPSPAAGSGPETPPSAPETAPSAPEAQPSPAAGSNPEAPSAPEAGW